MCSGTFTTGCYRKKVHCKRISLPYADHLEGINLGIWCGIDVEYFPSSNQKHMSARDEASAGDAELLAALEGLASLGVYDKARWARPCLWVTCAETICGILTSLADYNYGQLHPV